MYPGNVLYANVTEADVDTIIQQHLIWYSCGGSVRACGALVNPMDAHWQRVAAEQATIAAAGRAPARRIVPLWLLTQMEVPVRVCNNQQLVH